MTWCMKSSSDLLLSCSLLMLLILSLCYNPLIKQLKGEEMEKRRAAWFRLRGCLPAECSCRTADVHAVTPSVPGRNWLWGGCRWQFTKGLSNAHSSSAWLEAGKRNSNNTERKKSENDLVLWGQQALTNLVLGCKKTFAD